MSETIVLNNSEIYPTDEVLVKTLGKDIFRVQVQEKCKLIIPENYERNR